MRWLSRIAIAAALALAVTGTDYWLWPRGAGKRDASGPRIVPVSIAAASRQSVPIYVRGLGTVVALNTVPIHSQIDGKLIEIAFTEGQRVKKGDVLAKIDPRLFQAAVDQAFGRMGQDEANLMAAEKDLVRGKALAAKSFETQKVVDQLQGRVDSLKSAIAADHAAMDAALTQLDYTVITSPIDGRAGIRQIDIGNVIHANDVAPLVVITQTEPAAVIFTLPEMHIDALRAAMAGGPVEVAAFDRNNINRLATGQLLLIDGTIDQTTATMRLKAIFPNKNERLWPGGFVNARVLLETRRDAVTVSSVAVQRGPQGLFVWAVGPDDAVQMRPIAVGPPADDVTIVMAGIDVGDCVVTEGAYRLQPGVKVTLAPTLEPTRAAMIPASTGKPP
jgi:multidrug efflux system membrane fusion protein